MSDTSLFKKLWNGLFVPRIGAGLIEGLEKSLSLAGITIPVSDLEAAALILDEAETQGAVISSTNPAHFNVGAAEPVKYTCTGKSSGKWRLIPFNEPEYAEDTYDVPWTGQKQFSFTNSVTSQGMMTTSLPARPYTRSATVTVSIWGKSLQGNIDLRLNLHGGAYRLYRLTTDDSTVGGTATCVIPAGQPPNITAELRSSGVGKVELIGDPARNQLSVTAVPIRMTL